MKTHWSANEKLFSGSSVFDIKYVGFHESMCWSVDPEFKKANTTLTEACRENGDYVTPCQEQPELFTTKTTQEGKALRGRPRKIQSTTLTPYAKRVETAIALCGTCRVFNECRGLLATVNVMAEAPAITGVLAGYLVDPSPAGVMTRNALQMPKEADSDII